MSYALFLTRTTAIGAFLAAALPAAAQNQDVVQYEADAIKYAAGPPSLDEGAEVVVLYGDPGAEDLFSMRLRLPDGFHIAPHHHTQPEIVTVISGTFLIGHGEEADREATTALEPGSFFAYPPSHVHFAYAEGETVVQLNSRGPWTITYVDEAEDPRVN